jgi:hypothetical protein
LIELDIGDGIFLEREEEGEGNEKEGNEDDETASNDYMEHCIIVVAPGRPRRSRS